MVTRATEYIDYDVSGNTHEQVVLSIEEARASRPELHGHDAYTEPVVVLEQEDLGNGFVQSRAWLRTTVWLPRLVAGAPDDVAACFAKYRAALEEHEGLH